MAFLSWLTGKAAVGAISGLVKGFGGIATDLRKMRLDAEVAMAETKSAERREELRAQVEIIDRMVSMNEQANNHMQKMMGEWWMKLPMLGIMWLAFLWLAQGLLRSMYFYAEAAAISQAQVDIIIAVIYSMFGVGGLLMASNRLSK